MITDTTIGTPYYIRGSMVGRIVEHSDKGSTIDGVRSIVIFSTPHGSVIETGIAHLSEIDDAGMALLQQYERQVKSDKLYAGKYKPEYL